MKAGQDRDTFKNMEEWTCWSRSIKSTRSWVQSHSAVVEAVPVILDVKQIFACPPENSLGSSGRSCISFHLNQSISS